LRTLEGPTPYQDDYIYASPELADAMRLIDVARTDTLEAVSDHFPLVAEIPD
jgi:endonuclease/exonuclease/phosphatase family metal-dependent hydrolase